MCCCSPRCCCFAHNRSPNCPPAATAPAVPMARAFPLLRPLLLLLILALQSLLSPLLLLAGAQVISQSVALISEPAPSDQYQASLLPVTSPALSFLDLLQQKRFGNPIPQCPCVVLHGSGKCVVYDGRYQAALLEEAMLTFVDNSMDPRIFEERIGGGQISAWTLECHTEECRQCVGMLTLRLTQIGLLQGTPQFPFQVPGPSQLRPLGCPRLRMSRAVPHFNPPSVSWPPFGQIISATASVRAQLQSAQRQSHFARQVDQVLSLGRQAAGQPLIKVLLNGTAATQPQLKRRSPAAQNGTSKSSKDRGQSHHWVDRDIMGPGRPRTVRQQRLGPKPGDTVIGKSAALVTTRKAEQPIIGERHVINCVERGDQETEDNDFLNLCTSCWTWRQLPDDYFPRIINELVCQENDFCLSGWGICRQRYRNLDVLQRVRGPNGQEEWRATTISAATCCDCKVKAGSQAHSLVVGGRS